jgi:hypothetical protein
MRRRLVVLALVAASLATAGSTLAGRSSPTIAKRPSSVAHLSTPSKVHRPESPSRSTGLPTTAKTATTAQKHAFRPPKVHRRTSRSRDPGRLPFTGSHLAAFTSLGIALIAAGLLLRLAASPVARRA